LHRSADVEDARAALALRHHIAALGRLAPSIAHEVSDPLSYVTSNLRHALRMVAELEAGPMACELGELLHEALEGAERIRSVAEGLRRLGQGTVQGMALADLNQILETVLQIVRARTKDRVAFELCLATLPQVGCHRYQLAELLLTLLESAIAASGDRGTVRVTTREAAPWVEVEICHGGAGIRPDAADPSHDPLSRRMEGAAGLGLAISREIAAVHGGSLTAAGCGGAPFRLRLPAGLPGDGPSGPRSAEV
jgi:signal transduction histidine kinase